MKEIGGYLELELGSRNTEYHSGMVDLNTGRNALEYILRLRGYRKLYLPHYHCDALIIPLQRLGIEYQFYSIDYNFEFADITPADGEALLYINFFGLKDAYIAQLAARYSNLIIDNAHSFYSVPLTGIDTFYSCRKFFGVPDGAYVAASATLDAQLPHDHSSARYQHLIGRYDQSATAHYSFYREVEELFDTEEMKLMSPSTKAILSSIDYTEALQRRRSNYKLLHAALEGSNRLQLPEDSAGMSYPLLASRDLMIKLIHAKVYIGTYWPNVIKDMPHDSVEYDLAYNLLSLPIDQRYSGQDMEEIIKRINND
jgi:hypothetical protein